MNWKALAVLGAAVGAAAWAVQQRRARQQAIADSGWADATDRVVPAPAPSARTAVQG